MKKLVLFIYLAGIAAFVGYSQSLTLADSTGPVANGATVVRTGLPSDDVITSYIFVTNTTAAAMDVKVKKVEISLVPGSMNLFCWGLCFAPSVYESPDPVTINGGSTNKTDFVGDYSPLMNPGVSTIMYVFFDSHNPSDTVCFKVDYTAYPLGVEPVAKGTEMVVAYPNPANSVVHMTYNVPAGSSSQIVVRNILGTKVKEIPLANVNGKETVSVSDMTEGVYFYSLVINGQNFSTKKLVIKH